MMANGVVICPASSNTMVSNSTPLSRFFNANGVAAATQPSARSGSGLSSKTEAVEVLIPPVGRRSEPGHGIPIRHFAGHCGEGVVNRAMGKPGDQHPSPLLHQSLHDLREDPGFPVPGGPCTR